VTGLIVHVANERSLHDLVSFLEAGALAVRRHAPRSVDVEVPRAANRHEAKRELAIYLATWRAMHPGIRVDMTPDR
jgi:hypothetical protein